MNAPMTRDDALAEARSLLGPTAQVIERRHAWGTVGYIVSRRRGGETDVLAYGTNLKDMLARLRADRERARQGLARFVEAVATVEAIDDGATITRVWRGVTYTVRRAGDGFTWNGRPYTSLTAVARAITGAKSINGRAWFGVAGRKEVAP